MGGKIFVLRVRISVNGNFTPRKSHQASYYPKTALSLYSFRPIHILEELRTFEDPLAFLLQA